MGCFYMPKVHRKYNGTQKVEIIERIRSEQLSFHEASKEYDIPRQTIQNWERIYENRPLSAECKKKRGKLWKKERGLDDASPLDRA